MKLLSSSAPVAAVLTLSALLSPGIFSSLCAATTDISSSSSVIPADSEHGLYLLSKARQVEQNQNNNNQQHNNNQNNNNQQHNQNNQNQNNNQQQNKNNQNQNNNQNNNQQNQNNQQNKNNQNQNNNQQNQQNQNNQQNKNNQNQNNNQQNQNNQNNQQNKNNQNQNNNNNQNKNNNNQNYYASKVDTTWVAGYSLKFQGCHQISEWNPNVDQEEDVRIETKRLARFRLCPTSTCSSNSGGGCTTGYGDYIVDMDIFLQAFMANKSQICATYAQSNCSCQQNNNNNNNGGNSQQSCLQQCYTNAGMSECIAQSNNGIYVNNYLQCTGYQPGSGGRLLANNQGNNANGNANNNNNANKVQYSYYIGPYCSDQGGKIVLGLFTDDSCTEFADSNGGRSTYENLTGMSLPYSTDSIVDTQCYSCKGEQKNNNGSYQTQTKYGCSQPYVFSGKCETQLSSESGSSVPTTLNENACTYMEGIKITRSNGIIIAGAARTNTAASAFTGIFAVSFVLLGSYVYYLKTKIDRSRVKLSDHNAV